MISTSSSGCSLPIGGRSVEGSPRSVARFLTIASVAKAALAARKTNSMATEVLSSLIVPPAKGPNDSRIPCPFRKLYPNVMVVQPGQDWDGDNNTGPLEGMRRGSRPLRERAGEGPCASSAEFRQP